MNEPAAGIVDLRPLASSLPLGTNTIAAPC